MGDPVFAIHDEERSEYRCIRDDPEKERVQQGDVCAKEMIRTTDHPEMHEHKDEFEEAARHREDGGNKRMGIGKPFEGVKDGGIGKENVVGDESIDGGARTEDGTDVRSDMFAVPANSASDRCVFVVDEHPSDNVLGWWCS